MICLLWTVSIVKLPAWTLTLKYQFAQVIATEILCLSSNHRSAKSLSGKRETYSPTYRYRIQLPQNSENKPRGLYFWKTFEGLIFGGACIRREICVSKSIGLAERWKEIYVTVIDHGNMDRGNPSQEWKLNYGNRNKLWLFLTAIFGTRNSYLANIKIYIIVNRDYFVLLCIWGQFPSRSPLGLIFGGAILRYQFGGGGYIWRAYFLNFTLPVGVILDTYVSKEYSECSNSCVEWAYS